jgi:hypothetical protein
MEARRYNTPEEAARGDTPAQFVRVVGVVVRGDDAVVAQLTNDRPPFEVETAHCHREGDEWVAGMSGNSTSGFLPTGSGVGTVLVWDEAPIDAVAARFEYAGREQVVAVERGCAVAVFDDVEQLDGHLGMVRVAAWINAEGVETKLPWHEPPEQFRSFFQREFDSR